MTPQNHKKTFVGDPANEGQLFFIILSPYAGIIRIRFIGYNLRRPFQDTTPKRLGDPLSFTGFALRHYINPDRLNT